MVHICTIRCYKWSKNSKRSDWSRQTGSEGRNGEPRARALRQCVGCWVCDACNVFNQVHACTLTVNIFKPRGIFPVAKTLLTWVKQVDIWLPSIKYSPTKNLHTLINRDSEDRTCHADGISLVWIVLASIVVRLLKYRFPPYTMNMHFVKKILIFEIFEFVHVHTFSLHLHMLDRLSVHITTQ